MLPFAAAAFLAGGLAFTLECAAAKALLPAFGGAAAVWTTSVLVFQAGLWFANLAAGEVSRRFSAKAVGTALACALAVSALTLLPQVSASAFPASPMLGVAAGLVAWCGLPFLLLCACNPLLHIWAAASPTGGPRDPYPIFAASNGGSLCALLGYPFFIERVLTLRGQRLGAAVALSVLAVLILACRPAKGTALPLGSRIATAPRALWLIFSAAPCALMLAVTNLLAMSVAASPLLWVAPLSIYLLTLMLAFSPGGEPSPWIEPAATVLLAAGMIVVGWPGAPAALSAFGRLGLFLGALFVLCMLCHRRLARLRPEPGPALIGFYSWASLGGLAGSILVALVVPVVGRRIPTLWLDAGLGGALILAGFVGEDERVAAAWRRRKGAWTAGIALACAAAAWLLSRPALDGAVRVEALRNFYGVYQVRDQPRLGLRTLFHGDTGQGVQLLDPSRQGEPTGYYHRGSPLADVFAAFKDGCPIAAIGLGVGSIAAYVQPGQELDVYELDPDVEGLARRRFVFLENCRGRLRVVIGDARLSLERERRRYGLLVLDAFSGGAVPAHLLTLEAFESYLERLDTGGLILVHTSNRFLDLRRVLAAVAAPLGFGGVTVDCGMDTLAGKDGQLPSEWVALSRDPAKTRALVERWGWSDLSTVRPLPRPWTDQRSGLVEALRF